MKLKKPRQNYGKGFCGIGIYQPKFSQNVGTLIRSAKMLGADFVFMIGKRYKKQHSDVGLRNKIPIFYFKDLKDFYTCVPPIKKYTAIELVEKSIPLSQYNHPKEAIYLLGSEENGLPKEILESDRFEFIEIEG